MLVSRWAARHNMTLIWKINKYFWMPVGNNYLMRTIIIKVLLTPSAVSVVSCNIWDGQRPSKTLSTDNDQFNWGTNCNYGKPRLLTILFILFHDNINTISCQKNTLFKNNYRIGFETINLIEIWQLYLVYFVS